MILGLETRANVTPLWWRVPVWAALTVATVVQAEGLGHRIAAGVFMGAGAAAFQVADVGSLPFRRAMIVVATLGGLAACIAAPKGIAEVLVVVVAGRAPRRFDGLALRVLTVLDTIAFGATVGYITRSYPGILAGTAIPLLVQRQLEQQTVIRERDRAEALLAEVQAGREAETQAAALRERGRIAREMHDVLAHSLAGLSVQLQAVRAIAAREMVGEVVLGPLDKAAALAKDGLTEARAAVSTLRDPVGLGVDDVPSLVERHPGHATLLVEGTPLAVDADAGHAVYRGVQESLTNAARNAPGSPVVVSLTWSDATLTVCVRDDGPAPGRTVVGGTSTGLGLAGMAERVTQAGGTVTAGPRTERGWETRIEVPVSST